MSSFVTRNKPYWDELEQLLKKARKSMRRMSPEELSRLDVLYRRTTVHLSQVATRTTDARLVEYLNGLTALAHSLIYLPPKKSMLEGAVRYIIAGFAQLIARHWRCHTVSALLLMGGGLLAYTAALHDTRVAYALMQPGDPRMPGSSKEQLLEVLRSGRETSGGGKFFFASFLFSHNLKVGIVAMGTGVLAGVPTAMLMVYTGMFLGSFVAIHHKAGIDAELWAWLLPHGFTEIGAIVLCGGIGLMLGRAVVSPGILTRRESIRQAGTCAAQTFIGVAIMLVAAAIIESYVRQSHLSTSARFVFAAATAIFWALYFTSGLLRERAPRLKANSAAAAPQID